jgi:hypothetical protein
VADQVLTGLGSTGQACSGTKASETSLQHPCSKGKRAREEEKAHLIKVRDSVAPLFGVSLNWPAGWPDLRRALTGHVSGNAAATEALRRTAVSPPYAGVGRVMEIFLRLPQQDAEYMVAELTS